MIRDRGRLERTPAHAVALDCLAAGIAAAAPERAVRAHVSMTDDTLRIDGTAYALGDYDEIVVVGAGKGVVGLVRGLEAVLGARLSGGLVIAPEPASTDRVEVVVGDHPLPSKRTVDATERLRQLVELADDRTLLIAAFTGGGSALCTKPAAGISLADLRATTETLLGAGVEIDAVNAVRKHLSAVKGGQLATATAGADVLTLLVSDVVGDEPAIIASGPFSPDETTYADACRAIDGVAVPASVREHLERGAAGERPETPGPGDPAFDRVSSHVLASGETAIEGAATAATEAGYNPHVLEPAAVGEAADSAADHVAAARQVLGGTAPVAPPAVLLTGGELTVTVTGDGTGGPNQEFCLAASLACPAGVVVGAVDTDGRDGSTNAAGALVDETTVDDRAAAEAALAANDSYSFLDSREALLRTGSTGTNVNDLRVVVVW